MDATRRTCRAGAGSFFFFLSGSPSAPSMFGALPPISLRVSLRSTSWPRSLAHDRPPPRRSAQSHRSPVVVALTGPWIALALRAGSPASGANNRVPVFSRERERMLL